MSDFNLIDLEHSIAKNNSTRQDVSVSPVAGMRLVTMAIITDTFDLSTHSCLLPGND